MRWAVGAMLGVSLSVTAAETPLRFVVPDSWAMPILQLERGRPTQGILYDIMLSLATQVGVPAQFVVLPRTRRKSGRRGFLTSGKESSILKYRNPSERRRAHVLTR